MKNAFSTTGYNETAYLSSRRIIAINGVNGIVASIFKIKPVSA